MLVNDDGRYRRAITAGEPDQRRVVTAIDGDQVTWPDGTREHVDTVILATGYRPALSYLDNPTQVRGLSTVHPGLGFVGLEWQRSFASATLRGVARYVVRRLLRKVSSA
jgi:putative flavoprotein involved in K+ transport